MKNIMHFEDLAFFEDPGTIIEIVSALIFTIATSTKTLGNLSIKYDGAPLIVFGNEDGFFVADKSYLNKTPNRYRSIEEIEYANIHEEKKDKLAAVYHEFADTVSKMQNGMVYYSDYLFANYYEHYPKITKSFQPNIIRYELRHGNFQDYRLGLAPHLRTFCGQPLEGVGLPYNTKVWWPQPVPICQHPFNLENSIFNSIRKLHLDLAIGTTTQSEVKELRTYLNTLVRKCTCYTPILLKHYKKKNFTELADNLDILIKIKYTLLNYLNDPRAEHNRLFKMSINGIDTTHEGYVFRYKNHVIKLVDRFAFSKANFDQNTERGWTKRTTN